MKLLVSLLSIVPFLFSLSNVIIEPVYAQSKELNLDSLQQQLKENKVRSGVNVATSWIESLDNEEYERAWDETSAYFKEASAQASMTRDAWIARVQKDRQMLGKILTRRQEMAVYTTEIKDAPKGEYVVVKFRTRYDAHGKRLNIEETITPELQSDGTWKISGYYIK